jgi:hypothetical protein
MNARLRRAVAWGAYAAAAGLVIVLAPRTPGVSTALALDGGCRIENVYVGDGVIRGHGVCAAEGTQRE